MSEIQLVQQRFKPRSGKKEWLDWTKEIKTREGEVLATLQNEGVRLEACFLSEDGQSVFYFMEVKDLKLAYKVFEKSGAPIDRQHKKVVASAFVKAIPLRKLFEFRNERRRRRAPRSGRRKTAGRTPTALDGPLPSERGARRL